jgi:hypothetical protein
VRWREAVARKLLESNVNGADITKSDDDAEGGAD